MALVYKRVQRAFDLVKTDRWESIATSRRPGGDAREVERDLREAGAEVAEWESDIGDERSVHAVFERVVERFGAVDVPADNAASSDEFGGDTFAALAPEVIDRTQAVNAHGTLLTTREFMWRRGAGGGSSICRRTPHR